MTGTLPCSRTASSAAREHLDLLRGTTEFFPLLPPPVPAQTHLDGGRLSRRGAGEWGIPHQEKGQQQGTGKGKQGDGGPGLREGAERGERGGCAARDSQAASPRAGNEPPARASPLDHPLAPAMQWVKPQPGSAQDLQCAPKPPASPPGRMGGEGTCACLVGEVHSPCEKDQSTLICPPFAGATPGRVKQHPALQGQQKAGFAQPGPLWCFPACPHQQDRTHREPRTRPSPARRQALPGPRSRNHPSSPAAPPWHGLRTGTEILGT